MFLEQFRARDGEVKEPTESMMLPTISLGEVDAALKKNTTYCFKTSPGVAGWCGTCKVGFVNSGGLLSLIYLSFFRLEPRKGSLVIAT